LKQVTDVINGKIVLGKEEEIIEVKNAYFAYDNIAKFDPYDIKSFLKAHEYLTASLVKSAGRFRSGEVGVFDGDVVVHLGARPEFLYDLTDELLKWAKTTNTHPLIVSAVVHYEIEFIHPFDDGNGRMGRLWQTTILSNWKDVFEYIPIETIVYKHQQEYYEAIAMSTREGMSNKFIIFMLRAINEVLDEMFGIELTDIITDKLSVTEINVLTPIAKYLLIYETIDNTKAQELAGKSAESTKKYLNKFVKLEILTSIGENKGRKYKLSNRG